MNKRAGSRFLLAGALLCASAPVFSAPKADLKRPVKKPAASSAAKPPPAPPKGKATFPKQKHRNPPGKIIKIFPGDKHLDPKALAAAPTAQQVAAKKQAKAVVQAPTAQPTAKKPAPRPKSKP